MPRTEALKPHSTATRVAIKPFIQVLNPAEIGM